MNIHEFLTREDVEYETITHQPTFTASHLAQSVDERGDLVAKTVVLKADGEYVLAVLQASHDVDMLLAQKALGCKELELATEDELASLFPDCEVGAVLPFGSLYNLKTWVDSQLAEDDHIVFEGQTHDEAIRLSYDSYREIEDPSSAYISHHR
jgi:Ala-tRNA(Pro) deacylase